MHAEMHLAQKLLLCHILKIVFYDVTCTLN